MASSLRLSRVSGDPPYQLLGMGDVCLELADLDRGKYPESPQKRKSIEISGLGKNIILI